MLYILNHCQIYFQVYSKSLGEVYVKAVAKAPDGRNLELTSAQPDDDIHYVSFLPTMKGSFISTYPVTKYQLYDT